MAASQDHTETYRMSIKATIIKLSKAIHQRLQFHQGGTVTIREEPLEPEEIVGTIPLAKELSSLLKSSAHAQREVDTFTKEVGLYLSGGSDKNKNLA